ncbi:hypothetical protein ES705_35260 [subsurface metagenome]
MTAKGMRAPKATHRARSRIKAVAGFQWCLCLTATSWRESIARGGGGPGGSTAAGRRAAGRGAWRTWPDVFLGGDGTAPGAPDRAAARAAPCAEGAGTEGWSSWLICGALARICKGQKVALRANLLEQTPPTSGERERDEMRTLMRGWEGDPPPSWDASLSTFCEPSPMWPGSHPDPRL